MPGLGKIIRGAADALFTGRMATASRVAFRDMSTTTAASLGTVVERVGMTRGSSGIGTLGGALLKKALPYYGAAKGIDFLMDETRAGEEMSGVSRFMAGALSFGLKANAVRHTIRGATGSALYSAGAAMGNPARFQQAYSKVAGKLDSVALAALKLPVKVAGGVLNAAWKLPVGIPYAAVSAARVGTNLMGTALFGRYSALMGVGRMAAFTGPGKLLEKAGLRSAGRAWTRAGESASEGVARWFERRPSLGAQLTPSYGGFLRSVPGLRSLGSSGFAQRSAPTMYGFAALGAMSGAAQSYARYKNEGKNWVPGNVSPNPMNYGGGMSVMRRGTHANYGPALTLMLHQNHSRVF